VYKINLIDGFLLKANCVILKDKAGLRLTVLMNLSPEIYKQILVNSGYVTEEEFDAALKSAQTIGRKLEDVLLFKGLISSEALSSIIAEYLGVSYVDLKQYTIPDEILALVPEKMARTYHMIPFAREGDQLKLAMEKPGDVEAVEFVKRHTGLLIVPFYSNHEDIKRALGQYKRNIRAEFEKVISENIQMAGGQKEEDLMAAAEKLPIIKVFDTILEYAFAERASDVHIEVQEKEVIIRFRIDGTLQDIIKLPRGIEEALVARIKILSNLKLDEKRVPQDGRYKFDIGGDPISLRISIIPGFYGENVVMRLLNESSRPLSLEELGLTGHNLDLVRDSIRKPNGMILVTGPTGSGKTTTLYSILNILNTIDVKIATIEDPIEYGVNRITQIQVNTKTGLTFAAGLRALLRHDPDIMMVGEIRDRETAEIAIHAALTGHLVLSTLHTNDAAGAIPRLLDMGVEGYLLASTVNIVIAQRLVKKNCNACITEYRPDEVLLQKLTQEWSIDMLNRKYYKGKGCAECHGSGYSGRIGIYETLPITEQIRGMITKGVSSDQIIDTAIKQGMTTMLQDGLDKIAGGNTTIEEVIKAVTEKT